MEYPAEKTVFPEVVGEDPALSIRGTTYSKVFYDGARSAITRIEDTLGLNPQGAGVDVAARFGVLERSCPVGSFVAPALNGGPSFKSVIMTANRLFLEPVIIPPGDYDRVSFEVMTGAANAKAYFVIYAALANGLPGTRAAVTAEIDVSAAGNKHIELALSSLGGLFYCGFIFSVGVTIRGIAPVSLVRVTSWQRTDLLSYNTFSDALAYAVPPADLNWPHSLENQADGLVMFLRRSA